MAMIAAVCFVHAAYSHPQLLNVGAGVPKPSAVTLDAILNDQELLAGFDDPEVLAAVNDIANNPDRGQQYATNKKVQ